MDDDGDLLLRALTRLVAPPGCWHDGLIRARRPDRIRCSVYGPTQPDTVPSALDTFLQRIQNVAQQHGWIAMVGVPGGRVVPVGARTAVRVPCVLTPKEEVDA